MKPFITPSFWSDSAIEMSKPEVKLAALWIITNSQTTVLGVCSTSSRRFAFETGMEPKVLDDTLSALPDMFRVVGGAIFIRNFIRHQFGAGDQLTRNNFFKRMSSDFVKLDPSLQAAVLSEYPEFKGLTKGLGRGSQPQGRDRIGKEEGESERGEAKARPSSELEVVEYCKSQGLLESDGIYLWSKWQGTGFRNGGQAIKDWKAVIRSWKAAGHIPSQKNGMTNRPKQNPTDGLKMI